MFRTGRMLGAGVSVLTLTLLGGCGQAGEDVAPTYRVSGVLSGLQPGETVHLLNNGRDALTVSSTGGFAFATELRSGEAYAVTIAAQPREQTCAVENGSGTVGDADVTELRVSCADSRADGGA